MTRAVSRIILLLLCLIEAIVAAPNALKFDPPQSVGFTVRSISCREQWLNRTKRVADSTFTAATIQLTRVHDGYQLESRQTAFSGNRNNIQYSKKLDELMSTLHTTLTIDTLGEAKTITGYEELYNRIDSLADSATAAMLKDVLSPQLMSDREVTDWNARMTYLVGRKLAINAIKLESEAMDLPDGAHLDLMVVSFIQDTARIKGRLTATVHVISDTDPKRLADSLGQTPDFVAKLFQLDEKTIAPLHASISRYQSLSDIHVDVKTLLPLREQIYQEIALKQVDLPEEKVITRVIETKKRTFTYTTPY